MNKEEAIDIITDQAIEFLFSYGFPSFEIKNIITKGIDAREWMLSSLEMTPDNMYRVKIPILSNINTKPLFYDFMKMFCKNVAKKYDQIYTPIDLIFVQDERKNKFKITKLLHKYVDCVAGTEEYESLKYFAMDNNRIELDIVNDIGKFCIWYGDQVCSGRSIIISGNTFDMLTASANASFTSCYSPGSSMFNGTISNSLSPHILIAYITEDPKMLYKIGRCWVYVNNKYIIPARKYGSIYKEHSLHIRNYISSRLGGDWILKSGGISSTILSQLGPGYVDEGHGERLENKLINGECKIIVPESICLFCGCSHKNGTKSGMCNACLAIK